MTAESTLSPPPRIGERRKRSHDEALATYLDFEGSEEGWSDRGYR
jgi:hypothetical protein